MNERKFQEFDPVITGFLDYLRDVRRLRRLSIIDMKCTFRSALHSMNRIRPGIALWKLTLDDYLAWIEASREAGKSVNSLCKEISHLKSLIEYAWRSGRTQRNVLDGFNLQDQAPSVSTPPNVLTVEEAKRLITSCPRKTTHEKRVRLMIVLLYGCGLRTSELCKLDVKDVDIERQELVILEAKGDIQRRVPVPDSVWTELLAYIAERKAKRGALFITEHKKRRIRSCDVTSAVHVSAERADLSEDVVPKTLRHSYATHLMDAGVDLAMIASLMGHRSPRETGVYLHALPGRKEAAVSRLALVSTNDDTEVTNNEEEGV